MLQRVFQSFINETFWDLLNQYVYIDDILKYSKSREQHMIHVRTVLLNTAPVVFQGRKMWATLFQNIFLGIHNQFWGGSDDQNKVKEVTQWPSPKTIKDLKTKDRNFHLHLQTFLEITGWWLPCSPPFYAENPSSSVGVMLHRSLSRIWKEGSQQPRFSGTPTLNSLLL